MRNCLFTLAKRTKNGLSVKNQLFICEFAVQSDETYLLLITSKPVNGIKHQPKSKQIIRSSESRVCEQSLSKCKQTYCIFSNGLAYFLRAKHRQQILLYGSIFTFMYLDYIRVADSSGSVSGNFNLMFFPYSICTTKCLIREVKLLCLHFLGAKMYEEENLNTYSYRREQSQSYKITLIL